MIVAKNHSILKGNFCTVARPYGLHRALELPTRPETVRSEHAAHRSAPERLPRLSRG